MELLGNYQGYKVYKGIPRRDDCENLYLSDANQLWFAGQVIGAIFPGTMRVSYFDEDKIKAVKQINNKVVTSAPVEITDELDEFFKGLSKNVDDYLNKVIADGIEF